MGSSSNNIKRQSAEAVNLHLSLSELNNFSTTCKVTNRIDIDKYFEDLKKTYEKPRSPRRVLRKSVSSSKIEVSTPNSSSRKKRSTQKRRSIGGELPDMDNNDSGISSPRQTAGYFNYDISKGHIVEVDKDENDEHCLISRQKSFDLSSSKFKRSQSYQDDGVNNGSDEEDKMDLTASYSEGDFRDFVNNNNMMHSKSCSFLSNLHERHKEHAMLHGKIDSVSEQNRRTRRRYFRRDKKTSSDKNRRHSNEDIEQKQIGVINNLEKMVQQLDLEA